MTINCTSTPPPAMTLDAVTSELAIRNLVSDFALASWKADFLGDFSKLWAEDGQWTLSAPFANEANGIDEILDLATKLGGGWEFFVQFVHSGVVKVDGDHATGRWVLQEVARSSDNNYNNYALYEDVYVEIDGKWYFSERHYQYIWLDDSTIPGQAFPVPPISD